MDNTIHVSGRGAVHGVLDITHIEISIDSTNKTYEEACLKAKENTRKICNIFEYNGKSGKMVKTTRIYIDELGW